MISIEKSFLNTLWDQVQFVIELDTGKEAELGIGLVRNEEYIGFYLNLTAWNINATSNVIQVSLRKRSKKKNDSTIYSQIILLNERDHGINFETLFKQKKWRW